MHAIPLPLRTEMVAMFVLVNTILLLSLYASSSVSVQFKPDPMEKHSCTCTTVVANVCMAWECLHYEVQRRCFPAKSEVFLRDGAKKTLDNLQVNDEILVADGTYEPVLDFLHAKHHAPAQFLRISTRNGSRPLFISPNHLIFLFDQRDEAIFARRLRLGDRLNRVTVEGEVVPDEIIDIQSTLQEGYFAPLTPSGTIVVDGFIASNYAIVSNHHLAHRFMSIYRLWIRLVGPARNEPSKEQVEIHWLLNVMESLFRYSFLKCLVKNEFVDDWFHSSALI